MRGVPGFVGRLVVLVGAVLCVRPAWAASLYATVALLGIVAAGSALSLIAGQWELTRRVKRREPSIVRPVDRETLRNRALLDHAPVPLLFCGIDGALHAANRAARQLFDTDGRLVAPPEALLAVLNGRGVGPEGRMVRLALPEGGAQRLYAVSISQGSAVGGIVTYLALTDVEAGMNAAEAQALRDLLQVVSHEVMNSLTPIASLSATAAELSAELPEGETSALIGEALGTIRRRADGLDRFVRAYRDLARLPAPERGPVDLRELLQECARLFEARWGRRISLDLVLPSGRVMIQLDKAQMEQALVNLLNNAAEAALQGASPRVRLSGAVQASAISILVQDNGTGIAPELRERIFQPFVSFKPGGNGVGLSLARQIVLGHGGRLVLDDGPAADPWRTTFRAML